MGGPGFHVARLAYVPDVEAVFAAEREARRALVEGQVTLGPPGGAPVRVRHSVLDSGSLREMVDGDPQTLGRFMEANPALLELDFPQPRPLTGLSLLLANGNYEVTARLTRERVQEGTEPEPVVYGTTVRSPTSDPQIELPFDRGPLLSAAARVEIRHLDQGETAKIHVRELRLAEGSAGGPRTAPLRTLAGGRSHRHWGRRAHSSTSSPATASRPRALRAAPATNSGGRIGEDVGLPGPHAGSGRGSPR